ncbi:MAG: hypothetical protein ACK53Y_24665, partial [bacterium]
ATAHTRRAGRGVQRVGSGCGGEGDRVDGGQRAIRHIVGNGGRGAVGSREENVLIRLRDAGRETRGVGDIGIAPISRGPAPEVIRRGEFVIQRDVAAGAGEGPNACA